MRGYPDGFDVEGPVQAEVFVIWLNSDHLELTGPCGAAPWLIELGESDHPMEIVERIVSDVVGPPKLLHSTSWRRGRGAVILSFIAVVEESQIGEMVSEPIGRAVLARSTATEAPSVIAFEQVVEHGLRHMAWLTQDDAAVAAALSDHWREALADYVPEPFRHLA
jgi:hypothetical protein